MSSSLRFTSADLESMPDDGKRYEIIDGELYVSKHPHVCHQHVCGRTHSIIQAWSDASESGYAIFAPGLLFADDDDVAPDVIWVSNSRYDATVADDGKLHAAPELVIEVLSPGSVNERRDREAKLKLYSRRGVDEYWIVNWRTLQVEMYRREEQVLRLATTLHSGDTLQTPLIPGFSCKVDDLFKDIRARRV